MMVFECNGACAYYVMVSKFQWKPFWLATQRDPPNDWTGRWQNGVNNDVFAQAPLSSSFWKELYCYILIILIKRRYDRNFCQTVTARPVCERQKKKKRRLELVYDKRFNWSWWLVRWEIVDAGEVMMEEEGEGCCRTLIKWEWNTSARYTMYVASFLLICACQYSAFKFSFHKLCLILKDWFLIRFPPKFSGKIPFVLSKPRICFLGSKDKRVLFETGLSWSERHTQKFEFQP